jgi:Kef-type K+ transport system membrane component KefB
MNNSAWSHIIEQFSLPLSNPVLIFSLILFIILLSPILMGKIRIPGIVGFIIAGIAVGPYGFNLLRKNSAIELFSTIGLLYIMFIAGIELDITGFKAKKHKSLIFGLFTFSIPMLIGFPVCYYLLGYSIITSILTASMFATHTLVAYPIVSKYGVSRNEAVALTVGGTILTDTAVLIMLAVITGAKNGSLTTEFWLHLGISLTLFTLIMFLIVPRIARWFFTRLESEKTSHYVFVLAVVFFSAFLSQLAGVEPIIGAFIAGLVLNRLIPHSSILMNRIEFVGNAIFIPFFLISVGMLVDLRVLFRGPEAIIVALSLTGVALAGKWLSAFATQKIFKYSSTQRNLIVGLSSAHAAATLAIILVGYKAHIIDDNILNGTIILILITCVVASLVTESASKKLVLSGADNPVDALHEDEQEGILVPIADFKDMESLLDFAVLLKDKTSEKPVTILSVVADTVDAKDNMRTARKQLRESGKYASANGTAVEVLVALDYHIVSGIIRTAKEKMSNLIIAGWPKKVNFVDQFMGSNSQTLVKNADANLFVCQFNGPLTVHKSIQLVCPPLLGLNNNLWLAKVSQLASELSLNVTCCCTEITATQIKQCLVNSNSQLIIDFQYVAVWEDYRMLSQRIDNKDLLIMILERKLSSGYLTSKNALYNRLESNFAQNSKILIYPQMPGTGEDGDEPLSQPDERFKWLRLGRS